MAMTNLIALCFDSTRQRIDTCHCEDPREGGRGNPFPRPDLRPPQGSLPPADAGAERRDVLYCPQEDPARGPGRKEDGR